MPATGPRTMEGKAVASQNAVRHGLYARPEVIVGDESAADWIAFHEDALTALAPEGTVEAAIASRIALTLWRLRRVPVAEAMLIERRRAQPGQAEEERAAKAAQERRMLGPKSFYAPSQEQTIVRPIEAEPPIPHAEAVVTLTRFEAHLNRQLVQMLHELEALQERRRGNPAPLARLDVTGLAE